MQDRRHLLAAAAALPLATVAAGPSPVRAQSPGAPAPARSPVYDQLRPEASALLMADYQPQFVFSTRSSPIDALVNNAVALAKAARAFAVPTITTTITADAFAGPMLAELQAVNPETKPIDRTVINAWADPRVRDAILATGRKNLLIGGLWTDNCVMLPALSALREGLNVYVVADACGDYDLESRDWAIQRLVQAGAIPMPWLAVMLEWQADWADARTAGAVNAIMRDHAKAVGIGGQYSASIRR